MFSILSRAVDAVRAWFGLNDPTENRLHASHGWLLPSPADVRAAAVAAPSTVPAPAVCSALGTRG
jgi:hypothetical protein